MQKFVRLCAGLGLLVLLGCNQSGSAPAAGGPPSAATSPVTDAASAATRPQFFRDAAQTNLARVKLQVGPAETTAELCLTIPQVATGLMHRKSIGPEETMLFVFAEGQQRSFYMKNVPFDIAAGYIDNEGILQEIVSLKAMEETPVPSKSDNIQFVLEAAPDWFTRHGVIPGAAVRTDKASLPVAFAGRALVR